MDMQRGSRRESFPASGKAARNFQEPLPQQLPHLDPDDIKERCRTALILAFPNQRLRAEQAAGHAKATPRTAENWFDGANGVSLPAFVNLARRVPELRKLACRLLEIKADGWDEMHPDQARALMEAYQAIGRVIHARTEEAVHRHERVIATAREVLDR